MFPKIAVHIAMLLSLLDLATRAVECDTLQTVRVGFASVDLANGVTAPEHELHANAVRNRMRRVREGAVVGTVAQWEDFINIVVGVGVGVRFESAQTLIGPHIDVATTVRISKIWEDRAKTTVLQSEIMTNSEADFQH